MAEKSLQIKRNKNIYATKDDAVRHLNSLVDKLRDGEIVLCRYFQNDTIQTLIGFETKYGVVKDGVDTEEIISTIGYVDSFNEIGYGFSKDENGITQLNLGENLVINEENKLQVAIDNNVINFLKSDKNGLKVTEMNANVVKTTEDIIVKGGPLALKEVTDSITDTDEDGNKIIKNGTNIQDLLLNLFCQEIYPTIKGDNSISGSVTSKIKSPIIDLSVNEDEVEVGTTVKIDTVGFDGNSYASTKNSQVTGLTYGYSKENNNIKFSSETSIIVKPTTGIVSTEIAYLQYKLDGFTNETKNITQSGTSVFEINDVDLGKIVDGVNKITVSISGQPILYQINEIESVYPCSNLGKTKSDCKTEKVEKISGTTTVPTNSANKTINGVRYGFYGMIYDDPNISGQEAFEYTSNNIRNLTPLKKAETFQIIGQNVGRVIIAIPKIWNVEIYEIRDEEQMNNNLWGSSTGYVTTPYDENTNIDGMRVMNINGANNYTSVEYNVYTFNPSQPTPIKQTVTFKENN